MKIRQTFDSPKAAVYDREIADLYYDLKVPFRRRQSFVPRRDLDCIEAMKFLNTAISGLDLRKPGSEGLFSLGSAGICEKKLPDKAAAVPGNRSLHWTYPHRCGVEMAFETDQAEGSPGPFKICTESDGTVPGI